MATQYITVSIWEFWQCETANLARTFVSTESKLTFKPRGNLELSSTALESIIRLDRVKVDLIECNNLPKLLVNGNIKNAAITKVRKLFTALLITSHKAKQWINTEHDRTLCVLLQRGLGRVTTYKGRNEWRKKGVAEIRLLLLCIFSRSFRF